MNLSGQCLIFFRRVEIRASGQMSVFFWGGRLVSGFIIFLLLAYTIGASTMTESKILSWLKTPDKSHASASIHSVILYLGEHKSLAALRVLPATTYDSVVWQNFPHIWMAEKKQKKHRVMLNFGIKSWNNLPQEKKKKRLKTLCYCIKCSMTSSTLALRACMLCNHVSTVIDTYIAYFSFVNIQHRLNKCSYLKLQEHNNS